MRYSVRSQDYGYTLKAVALADGKNVREARNCGQVFCDLSDAQVKALQGKGMVVKPIRPVSSLQVRTPRRVQPTGRIALSGAGVAYASAIEQVRAVLTPPLMGRGFNLAIIDTGIRASHIGFEDRIIYSKNFSASPSADDVFSHGTACAWLAAAGADENGIIQGIAPEAGILNIKVLNDDGSGDEESVVLGIDDVMGLDEARRPQIANLSLGSMDDGDPDNPLRAACRAASDIGMTIVAAAGNEGPAPKTITCPGTEPLVITIGALTPQPFTIFPPSSRGPTLEGNMKPDIVFYGDDLLLADASSDVAYALKAGSSFASAGMSGAAVLGWEALARLAGQTVIVPGTAFSYTVQPGERIRNYFSEVCVKPEGAPAGQDPTYGWGMPLGNLMLSYFRPMAMAGMFDIIVPVFAIALLAMMMKNMFGATKS